MQPPIQAIQHIGCTYRWSCIGDVFVCMLILSFAVRSLSDLANLPITFWSSPRIAHDTRIVRERARISSVPVAYPISIWSAPRALVQLRVRF
jgi:hypothetical protein